MSFCCFYGNIKIFIPKLRKFLKEAQSQLDRLIQNNSTDHAEINRLRSVISNETKRRKKCLFLYATVEQIKDGNETSVFLFKKMRSA